MGFLMKLLDLLLGYLQLPIWLILLPVRLINRAVSTKKTVCVIKLAAMGDLICLYPTIYALYEAGYNVVLITTTRSNPSLFKNCSAISKIILLNVNFTRFFMSLIKVYSYVLRQDVCINADQYYNLSKVISYGCSKSTGFKTKKNIQFYRYPVSYSYKNNEKYQFLKLANNLYPEISEELPVTDLFSTSNFLNSNGQLEKCVVLYPGSGPTAQIRRWPLENWVNLYFILNNIGIECKFIGGPDEEQLISRLEKCKIPSKDILINSLGFEELIGALRRSSAFIGNDAGLFHVADALEIPVVGIFGPNISSKWGSVRSESAHVEISLPCRPCIVTVDGEIPSICKLHHHNCIRSIEVISVYDALKSLNSFEFLKSRKVSFS